MSCDTQLFPFWEEVRKIVRAPTKVSVLSGYATFHPIYDPVLVLPLTAATLKVDLSDYQSGLLLRGFSGAVALANMTRKENNAHIRRLFRARKVTTGDLVEVDCPNLMAH